MIDALIVAAGKGLRMKAQQRKQYLLLSGLPILTHSLKAFDLCADVSRIYVSLPEPEIDFCRAELIAPAGLSKEVIVVAGGARRQDSVLNGLRAISNSDGIVLIHDGVRPLVSQSLIRTCIDGARDWGACIPAIEAFDTLKKVNPAGYIESTVARKGIQMAQTPQAFRLALIRQAHETAIRKGWTATDDASLLERMGATVHVIEGSRYNIKITKPTDLELAETYLKFLVSS
jgi:2-C-methyl-D-erythritol 4-phosphate cytidylyltransferase